MKWIHTVWNQILNWHKNIVTMLTYITDTSDNPKEWPIFLTMSVTC